MSGLILLWGSLQWQQCAGSCGKQDRLRSYCVYWFSVPLKMRVSYTSAAQRHQDSALEDFPVFWSVSLIRILGGCKDC